MGDRLRVAVGVMGNAALMLLYAAPILTFSRVIRKKSTEEFSCVPYIVALLGCLLYIWYGLPVKKVALMIVPVIPVFCITAMISAFVIHNHHHRKVFVGSVGFVATVAVISSPLVVMSPNFVGTPSGILQLVLYFTYRNKGIMKEAHSSHTENSGEKTKQQLQFMATEDNNGKI
ncbi:hypothetical protein RHSIM_Rhsim03G0199700 [Rhododendron simsii]|uniref:Uncharacterized protein n=1 Tax=Rhododendron simsii TaxID=118357 RepID=A0A834HAC6_RHOSS|nr:hypothetical protein RHSIM_Rhsim03G0199700 [Rhododendron simsii]